jgi:hypothetical protein
VSDGLKDETVEFIFEHTKEAPERQSRDIDALDAKMVQVFGAASVVIGLVGVSNENLGNSGAVNALLALAVASYIVAAATALFHLYPKEQRRSLHVEDLWPKAWNEDVKNIQHSLIEDIRKVHRFNATVLEQKRNTLVRLCP